MGHIPAAAAASAATAALSASGTAAVPTPARAAARRAAVGSVGASTGQASDSGLSGRRRPADFTSGMPGLATAGRLPLLRLGALRESKREPSQSQSQSQPPPPASARRAVAAGASSATQAMQRPGGGVGRGQKGTAAASTARGRASPRSPAATTATSSSKSSRSPSSVAGSPPRSGLRSRTVPPSTPQGHALYTKDLPLRLDLSCVFRGIERTPQQVTTRRRAACESPPSSQTPASDIVPPPTARIASAPPAGGAGRKLHFRSAGPSSSVRYKPTPRDYMVEVLSPRTAQKLAREGSTDSPRPVQRGVSGTPATAAAGNAGVLDGSSGSFSASFEAAAGASASSSPPRPTPPASRSPARVGDCAATAAAASGGIHFDAVVDAAVERSAIIVDGAPSPVKVLLSPTTKQAIDSPLSSSIIQSPTCGSPPLLLCPVPASFAAQSPEGGSEVAEADEGTPRSKGGCSSVSISSDEGQIRARLWQALGNRGLGISKAGAAPVPLESPRDEVRNSGHPRMSPRMPPGSFAGGVAGFASCQRAAGGGCSASWVPPTPRGPRTCA